MQSAESTRELVSCEDLFQMDNIWLEKRNKAVKKLFRGNEGDFKQFLSRIDPLQSWKEVLDVVDDEFKKRNISGDSKEATGLTDILFKRYFPSY